MVKRFELVQNIEFAQNRFESVEGQGININKYLVLNIFEVLTLVPALRAFWFPQKMV